MKGAKESPHRTNSAKHGRRLVHRYLTFHLISFNIGFSSLSSVSFLWTSVLVIRIEMQFHSYLNGDLVRLTPTVDPWAIRLWRTTILPLPDAGAALGVCLLNTVIVSLPFRDEEGVWYFEKYKGKFLCKLIIVLAFQWMFLNRNNWN